MAYASGGAAAAAAVAAIGNAVKASGVLISVDEQNFLKMVSKAEKPLIIMAEGGVMKKNYQYLMSHKGFAFFTKVSAPLMLPRDADIMTAKQIWIPS
jgi:formiminotetrahydrofolate cyclodeaminase